MQSLQTFINLICKQRKIHVSFVDLSGVLDKPVTKVSLKHRLHSNAFCDMAKSTPKGRRMCIRCKRIANAKATLHKLPFGGYCCYGLYEVAMPVVMDNTLAAVVYVGNAILDEKFSHEKIKKRCRFTGVDEEKLFDHLSECEYLQSKEELFQIAEIIADYLKILYKKSPKASHGLHWLVYDMKRYAEEKFWTDISLQELASVYHKNEKYLGRLFKKEMGVDFHQYCIRLRIEKAENMLLQSSDKIIDIALDCGFNNVSYFNRVFLQKHGISPAKYRALYSRDIPVG